MRPTPSMSSMKSGGLMSAMAPSPVDPYKYLVYRIIGRIGLEDTSIPNAVIKGLAGGILGWEDDIWFQLMMVREMHDGSTDRYTIADMASKYVSQFSVEQWTANGQFRLRYFQILLLCGQFEKGVQYLWNIQHEVDALHFSIALAYYGVLKIPAEFQIIEVDIGMLAIGY